MFIPVRYEEQFIDIQNLETKEIYDEEVKLDDDYRNTPESNFFPYINLSPIDLSFMK